MSDEETVFVDSPSMFRNNPIGFVVTLILCLVGVGIPILLVWYVRCRSTELTITNLRTRLHRGWLSRSITEVWHRDVRNVQLDQTFFQRILDTGRIGVSSAAQSGIEIDVSGLRGPDKIKGIIDSYRAKAD
ncbi:Bacterial membrane flanked domain protein [Rubripirellula tenax]|uniref:Bacterial membrane flanked domain protein n=1 Tax=Rubripirellula tenax TaxID=2528015 RepID=A0A5C6FCA3_9BACT|nr:PH domain-containing protein [Rubripirellula tenax]TWU59343.1 Bacterial membrane flanked domain protein [Rubripirellula tenax]